MDSRTVRKNVMKKAMLAITANQMSYDQGVSFIEGVSFSLNQIFLNISKADINKGMNEAIALASDMFRIPISELKGKCRLREVVDARVVFAWHMMDEGLRDEEIAFFLRKDRTTMIHFRKKKEDINFNPLLKEMYLKFKLKANEISVFPLHPSEISVPDTNPSELALPGGLH